MTACWLLLACLLLPRPRIREGRRMRPAAPPGPEATLAWLTGLVAGLEAGRPGLDVLRSASHDHGVADDVVAALVSAAAVPEALRHSRQGDRRILGAVAAAWSLHVTLGVGLVPVLRRVLAAMRDDNDIRRELMVEVAGPVMSVRVVAALPLAAAAGLLLLGVDYTDALLARPALMAGVAAGLVLDVLGFLWLRWILQSSVARD